jgi:septal ring factor EnvC (AmiA/AmiB activator)
LSKILEEQKTTIANLIASKNSGEQHINYDLETFRAQTARVENEIKDLQDKNFEMDIKIQSLEHDKTDLQEEVKNRELDLTKSKLMIEKMRNEIDTLKM